MILQFVQIFIVGQILRKLIFAAERVKVGEHRVSFHLSGIAYFNVVGVGIHRHYLFLNSRGLVRKVNAVPQRFAHLRLAVKPRQAEAVLVRGQHDFRFRFLQFPFRIHLPRSALHSDLIIGFA